MENMKNLNIVVSYLLSCESKALWMIPHVAEVTPDRSKNDMEVLLCEKRISPDHLVGFFLKTGLKAVQGRLPLFFVHLKL